MAKYDLDSLQQFCCHLYDDCTKCPLQGRSERFDNEGCVITIMKKAQAFLEESLDYLKLEGVEE